MVLGPLLVSRWKQTWPLGGHIDTSICKHIKLWSFGTIIFSTINITLEPRSLSTRYHKHWSLVPGLLLMSDSDIHTSAQHTLSATPKWSCHNLLRLRSVTWLLRHAIPAILALFFLSHFWREKFKKCVKIFSISFWNWRSCWEGVCPRSAPDNLVCKQTRHEVTGPQIAIRLEKTGFEDVSPMRRLSLV